MAKHEHYKLRAATLKNILFTAKPYVHILASLNISADII